MATLTNNINAQNVIDRFADYVVASGNAGIGFGTNAVPFGTYSAYFPAIFGGTTTGKAISITDANIGGVASVITASTIYNTLVAETNTYTRIRNLRAILFITGTGFIPGVAGDGLVNTRTDLGPITGTAAGVIYDTTAVANLNTNYLQNVGTITSTGVGTGSTITVANLEAFFTNLRTAYNNARAVTHTQQENVCHASCHSNCHSSRGRR